MLSFEISYMNQKIPVVKHQVDGADIFLLTINGSQLIITKAYDAKHKPFWTSIPEGNLKEAKSIGKLIDETLSKGQSLF